MTAAQMADRLGYDSIWAMDHSNVPQWKNAVVNDAWLLLAALGAVTRNVELGTCVTDAIRRHPSAIALSTITLRSEEHTSELQSRQYLVCRLLLEKKKTNKYAYT